MQRIDFRSSNIRWVTKETRSHGAFVLDAVLRRWIDPLAKPEIFALGAPVLAGNMYVNKDLCKNPPYLFQIAVGSSNHVIFRTSISAPVGNALEESSNLDTQSPNNSVFESITVLINNEPAKSLSSYDEIATHYFNGKMFTCIIKPSLQSNEKIELEFPVKHINLLPKCKMWQLETGPLLFPKRDDSSTITDEALTNLLPYYVFANQFDCAEFFPDFPFTQGTTFRARDAVSADIRCQVKLLVGDV